MPRIIPEPRYFSMPSSDVGSEVFKNFALYCWPWVRSLTHSPDAVIHSPAEITAACPTTVTNSRWPRALIRRTQKPFSSLWYVTRSTRPARTSRLDDSGCGFMRIVASLFRCPEHQLRTALFPNLIRNDGSVGWSLASRHGGRARWWGWVR